MSKNEMLHLKFVSQLQTELKRNHLFFDNDVFFDSNILFDNNLLFDNDILRF